jgi:hypothetical protein
MAGHFISNAQELVDFFAWRCDGMEGALYQNRAAQPGVAVFLNVFVFLHLVLALLRVVLEASHAVLEASHAVLEASHAVLEPSHVVLEPSHTVLEPSHVVLKASHVVLETSHVVLKASRAVLSSSQFVFAFQQVFPPSQEVAVAWLHVVGAPLDVVLLSRRRRRSLAFIISFKSLLAESQKCCRAPGPDEVVSQFEDEVSTGSGSDRVTSWQTQFLLSMRPGRYRSRY